MSIETGITLTVYADTDYYFQVEVSDEYSVSYVDPSIDQKIDIEFGRLEEMEALALAMLKAVRIAKDKV